MRRLIIALVFLSACGITTEDECREQSGEWVCVEDTPGPQRGEVCVCDFSEDHGAEVGPEPLPW